CGATARDHDTHAIGPMRPSPKIVRVKTGDRETAAVACAAVEQPSYASDSKRSSSGVSCMTRQLAKPQPLHARFGDAFVILSVTLLSLASGAWLITSVGLDLTSAMLAALAIYGILLLLHLLVRRSLSDSEDEGDDDLLHGDSHWQTGPAAERFEAALA